MAGLGSWELCCTAGACKEYRAGAVRCAPLRAAHPELCCTRLHRIREVRQRLEAALGGRRPPQSFADLERVLLPPTAAP